MTALTRRPQGIGVDIVDATRIQNFIEKHESSLNKILTESELQKMMESTDRVSYLSYLFSAKEAVFKSLDLAWFGIEGFRMIEVTLNLEQNQATAVLTDNLLEQTQSWWDETLIDFETKDNSVVAKAISYSKT